MRERRARRGPRIHPREMVPLGNLLQHEVARPISLVGDMNRSLRGGLGMTSLGEKIVVVPTECMLRIKHTG
jgi:hypothetical protein